jgi:sugar transferase EpsL
MDQADTTKRAMDVVLAVGLLILLAPVFAAVAVAVRFKLGSPVLFRQQRPGLRGQPFQLVKFRTMTDAKDGSGQLLDDAARLGSLGRFLRSTSLDELPELVNVLRGEMSLVGPRPLLPEYLRHYSTRQARRHEVRPGITGWAQVNGRNASGWEERLEMDVWYVDNRSLGLDLRILLRTLLVPLHRRGISAEGHATAPRFDDPERPRSGR